MSNGLAKCAIATPKPRKKSGCDKRPEVHADGLEMTPRSTIRHLGGHQSMTLTNVRI
jgi:hypothetical protein